jgi:regulator of CtrA degradation
VFAAVKPTATERGAKLAWSGAFSRPAQIDPGQHVEDKRHKQPVAIGPRIVASGGFDMLYREGMGLIEEVAAYLDGEGRGESRGLPREASFVYATESMRLTTRLMQLASWLLLQRAVNEGELTPENARLEKEKVRFSATPTDRGGPGFSDLPERLRSFIAKGDRLFDRVQQFDKLERGGVPEYAPAAEGGIADQLARLKAAFGKLRE